MQFFNDYHVEIKRTVTLVGVKNQREQQKRKKKPEDLYQKIQEIKGKFKLRLEMLNDQQGSILSDQEKIEGR